VRPRANGARVGIGIILGFVSVFFGGGTAVALMLCASGDDAERRLRDAFDAETDQLEREANELVLR
jgi:hypothetical protein